MQNHIVHRTSYTVISFDAKKDRAKWAKITKKIDFALWYLTIDVDHVWETPFGDGYGIDLIGTSCDLSLSAALRRINLLGVRRIDIYERYSYINDFPSSLPTSHCMVHYGVLYEAGRSVFLYQWINVNKLRKTK